jgi:hypothetical protein
MYDVVTIAAAAVLVRGRLLEGKRGMDKPSGVWLYECDPNISSGMLKPLYLGVVY